jgi:hypothetical protein
MILKRDDPLFGPKDIDAWMKAQEERIRYMFEVCS